MHCPAKTIWVDVLNKMKQGASFRQDRSKLMNAPIDYNDNIEHTKTHPKLLAFERVGKSDKPSKVELVQVGARPFFHRRSVLGK